MDGHFDVVPLTDRDNGLQEIAQIAEKVLMGDALILGEGNLISAMRSSHPAISNSPPLLDPVGKVLGIGDLVDDSLVIGQYGGPVGAWLEQVAAGLIKRPA